MIKLAVFSFITKKRLRRLFIPSIITVSLAFSVCQLILLFLVFFPQNKTFSYEGQVCTFGTLLPSLHSYTKGDASLEPESVVKIGSFPLFAKNICVSQTGAPQENTSAALKVRYFHIPFYEKRISLRYETLPTPTPTHDMSRPVSVLHPLQFELDKTDAFFTYSLSVADRSVVCDKDAKTVLCDLQPLKLKHGDTHSYVLKRSFENTEPAIASSGTISILEPVTLSPDFVGTDMVVYQSPAELVLKPNKPLSQNEPEATLTLEGDSRNIISGISIGDTSLHLSLSEPLKRKVRYLLNITALEGSDGSTLESPYTLSFTTSGGPKVTGMSIRSVSVDRAADPVITFDQTLLDKDVTPHVTLMNGLSPVAFSTRISENRLTVIPRDYLPTCATLTLSLSDKIENQFGISGDSAYSFSFRTTCFRTASIGTSVKGRSIVAYYFGHGGTMLLYVGAMHGGEVSSKYTMDSWISELDANYPNIPPELTIVVIPSLNPDGVATGSRLNANGVDLNRNFPTSDWQSGIYTSSSSYMPQGGGTSPLSEPESKALADFVGANRPRLTISYHSQGSYVIANDGGDSRAQAAQYSNLTGYRYFDSDNYGDAFEYNVTGTFDDWARQAYGLSELLVELPSHGGNYFYQNKSALWRTVETR